MNLNGSIRQLVKNIYHELFLTHILTFQFGEAKKLLQQYEVKTQKLTKENEFKNKELETVRYMVILIS